MASNPIPGSRLRRAAPGEPPRGRPLGGRVARAAAGAALVGVAAGAAAYLLSSPQHPPRAAPALPELHGQSSWASGERPAPPFALATLSGGTGSLAALRGQAVLLAFTDSRCAPGCPFLGRAISEAEQLLPAAARPAVVVVSTNPAADTDASVRAALRRWQAPPGWEWLSGSAGELGPVWRAYGLAAGTAARPRASGSALYLIDARGDERAGYLPPILPNFLALDIRRVEADTAREREAGSG